ncbi:MAG TPA: DUF904 domain-containing protein [Noviherbaspirillum sp.]
MISDIHQLADRIAQLAELAQALRRENAELRGALASAAAEKAELSARIDEAHARVSALLDRLPAAEAGREAA